MASILFLLFKNCLSLILSSLIKQAGFIKSAEEPNLRTIYTNACTESWNNGMVEGFVNKVKWIKRSSYGQAGFPLLQHRVLLHPHARGPRRRRAKCSHVGNGIGEAIEVLTPLHNSGLSLSRCPTQLRSATVRTVNSSPYT